MRPILRRSLWTLGGLAALLVAFHTVENLRGKRAWEQWKAQRRALGEAFDPRVFAPPAVPEAENFAAHPFVAASLKPEGKPLFAPLPKAVVEGTVAGNWTWGQRADLQALEASLEGQTLASLLAGYDQPLKDLAEAAQRPQCRLVQEYGVTENLPIPALLGWRNGARVLRLRSLVALREGRGEDALRDVLLGLRVAQHFQKEPQLISQLLRIAWTNMILQPIWEGLQDRRWSSDQLARLQAGLEPLDLLASWSRSLRYERTLMRSQVEAATQGVFGEDWFTFLADQGTGPGAWARRWGRRVVLPKGWAYRSFAVAERFQVELGDENLRPDQHQVRVKQRESTLRAIEEQGRSFIGRLALMQIPAIASQDLRVARAQVGLDHARLACALERYRLARGSYPESLEALVPACLPDLRPGLLEGIADRFARTAKGYRLHSVGWNLTDEGGAYADASLENPKRLEHGDWVWSRGDQK